MPKVFAKKTKTKNKAEDEDKKTTETPEDEAEETTSEDEPEGEEETESGDESEDEEEETAPDDESDEESGDKKSGKKKMSIIAAALARIRSAKAKDAEIAALKSQVAQQQSANAEQAKKLKECDELEAALRAEAQVTEQKVVKAGVQAAAGCGLPADQLPAAAQENDASASGAANKDPLAAHFEASLKNK